MITLSLNHTRLAGRVEALERIVSILLQGITLHALQPDQEEYAVFKSEIRGLRAAIESEADDEKAVVLAGMAVRLLEEHNDFAGAATRVRQEETEKVAALMADAFLEVSKATPEAMVRVKELERDVAAAPPGAALTQARIRLSDFVERMKSELAASSHISGPGGEMDPITGLPDSGFAAQAMSAVWERREGYFAAVCAVERLESINARFGFRSGDQVLLALSSHVKEHLLKEDQLFRWRGPCLLALLHRDMPESFVASEIARMVGHRMQQAITIGDREVMVPVNAAWTLFPLSDAASMDQMLATLNTYALNRARFTAAGGR